MPFRYPPDVRAAILARVAGGEAVADICRSAGMPCAESVAGWMRRDGGFAAAMRQARAAGAAVRDAYDEPLARAFVARLADGETLAALSRDPRMPRARTLALWKRREPWFAEAVSSVVAGKRAAKAAWARGRFRAFDAAVAERIYVRAFKGEPLRAILRSDRAFPSLAVLARWRAEQPEFDAQLTWAMTAWTRRRGRARRIGGSPELTREIVEALLTGESLRSLGRRADMPSAGTLYAWVRERPEFAAAVSAACADRADWFHDRMMMALDLAEDAEGLRQARREVAALSKQETRLRKRPGWKRAP